MHLYYHYLCIGLFLGMLVSQIFAYRYGQHRGETALAMGGSTVETAIFALMGLIIAFTFATAQTRYEYRRQLIVQEMNAVRTAFLRMELLPNPVRQTAYGLFEDLLHKRIDHSSIKSYEEGKIATHETAIVEIQLWDLIVQNTVDVHDSTIRMLLLRSINDLYNIATTRILAAYTHTSTWIILMFTVISIICSLLSGFRMAKQRVFSWNYALIYSFTIALTMYIILDFEYPRLGFIQLEKFEETLIEQEKNIIQQLQQKRIKL